MLPFFTFACYRFRCTQGSTMNAAARLIALAALASFAPTARAQCTYTTSMVDTYIASGPLDAASDQSPASGWTYERTGPTGTARILLEGVLGSWGTGAWGSPLQAFFVPLAGPIYSPDPQVNENSFYYRLPSYTGLMLHPGFGADDCRAILSVQAQSTLAAVVIQAEHLGQSTPNYLLSAFIERTNGSTVQLVASTSILSLAPAVTLSPLSGTLPLTLSPGDRLIINTGNGGEPYEDWPNISVTATLSGPPLIATQPILYANCGDDTTARIVAQGASSYRWRRAGVDLVDGPTATGSVISGADSSQLTIESFGFADEDSYDCVVQNTCGTVTSTPAVLTSCFADVNCDGGIDGDDVITFFTDWDQGLTAADFNQDGGVDGDDVIAFFERWDGGC
jgi:hypothetical protein